jgi:hypothetical protein
MLEASRTPCSRPIIPQHLQHVQWAERHFEALEACVCDEVLRDWDESSLYKFGRVRLRRMGASEPWFEF